MFMKRKPVFLIQSLLKFVNNRHRNRSEKKFIIKCTFTTTTLSDLHRDAGENRNACNKMFFVFVALLFCCYSRFFFVNRLCTSLHYIGKNKKHTTLRKCISERERNLQSREKISWENLLRRGESETIPCHSSDSGAQSILVEIIFSEADLGSRNVASRNTALNLHHPG